MADDTTPTPPEAAEKQDAADLTEAQMQWLDVALDGKQWAVYFPDMHFVLVTQADGPSHISEMFGGNLSQEDDRARYIIALHNSLPSLLSMARRTAAAEADNKDLREMYGPSMEHWIKSAEVCRAGWTPAENGRKAAEGERNALERDRNHWKAEAERDELRAEVERLKEELVQTQNWAAMMRPVLELVARQDVPADEGQPPTLLERLEWALSVRDALQDEVKRLKEAICNIAMVGRMIHANSKATETIKTRAKDIRRLAMDTVPESAGSILRSAEGGKMLSNGTECTCSIENGPDTIADDLICPVHGEEHD